MRAEVRSLTMTVLLLLACFDSARATAQVISVDSIGMTVSDLDRAVDFYTHVLTFEKESEREVAGTDYEHLFGVFGMRLRVARLKLGGEHIELMQFLAPRGRPTPPDFRSNDVWFQHVAIIVRNMDEAYARLRRFKVEHASSGPQRLPDSNPDAGGIKAFYFRDPDGNHLEILEFPPDKGAPRWHAPGGHALHGHRSHRHRGDGYAGEPSFLPRCSGNACGRYQ